MIGYFWSVEHRTSNVTYSAGILCSCLHKLLHNIEASPVPHLGLSPGSRQGPEPVEKASCTLTIYGTVGPRKDYDYQNGPS